MPIQNGKYVSPIWHNGGPPALDAEELQAMTDSIASAKATTYGVCNTPTANPAKVVTVDNFILAVGQIVVVKFNNAVGGNTTLNINGTGAFQVLWSDKALPFYDAVFAGSICTFVYSGNVWNLLSIDVIAAKGIGEPQSFARDSWALIQTTCLDGTYKDKYTIGDTKEIQLTTGERVVVRIEDFDHDNLTSGGKSPISIATLNCLNTVRRMNPTNINIGGWGSSEMRSWSSGTLFGQLPNDLQAVIKPVDKLTSAGNQSTNIVTTSDKLWALSYTEVGFSPNPAYSPGGEGDVYPAFVDNASRIKKVGASANYWWFRSPYVSNAASFDAVGDSGTPSGDVATVAYGVVFGFCI